MALSWWRKLLAWCGPLRFRQSSSSGRVSLSLEHLEDRLTQAPVPRVTGWRSIRCSRPWWPSTTPHRPGFGPGFAGERGHELHWLGDALPGEQSGLCDPGRHPDRGCRQRHSQLRHVAQRGRDRVHAAGQQRQHWHVHGNPFAVTEPLAFVSTPGNVVAGQPFDVQVAAQDGPATWTPVSMGA